MPIYILAASSEGLDQDIGQYGNWTESLASYIDSTK